MSLTQYVRIRSYKLIRPIVLLNFDNGVACLRYSCGRREFIKVLQNVCFERHRYAEMGDL